MTGVRPTAGTPDVDELLDRHSVASPPTASAGAAVVIVLRRGAADVEALLIERAVRAEDPASGQIGLPGGHTDAADPDLRATAVRELTEEVGLGSEDLRGPPRFVGIANAAVFQLEVGVFAAELSETSEGPRSLDATEVARVFWLPRAHLDRLQTVPRETSGGAVEVPAAVFEGHVLWGFTLRVLRQFFGRRPLAAPDPLLGMARPGVRPAAATPRRSDVPLS